MTSQGDKIGSVFTVVSKGGGKLGDIKKGCKLFLFRPVLILKMVDGSLKEDVFWIEKMFKIRQL